MPFVGTHRASDLLNREKLPEKLGDICCLAYVPMVQKFLVNKSWTTIHRIREEVDSGIWKKNFLDSRKETFPPHFLEKDLVTATRLAWDVFWAFYGLEYERERKKENGGVIDRED